jgi:hypothetical protein
MKAIGTTYAACRFRSRLEARWAVFFDALEIDWQYEPQGYMYGEYCYLPDFYLPGPQMHVEVRPHLSVVDQDRPRLNAFVAGGDHRLLLLCEIPAPHGDMFPPLHPVLLRRGEEVKLTFTLFSGEFMGAVCMPSIEGASKFWSPDIMNGNFYLTGATIGARAAAAYRKARCARFEFGETPTSRRGLAQ